MFSNLILIETICCIPIQRNLKRAEMTSDGVSIVCMFDVQNGRALHVNLHVEGSVRISVFAHIDLFSWTCPRAVFSFQQFAIVMLPHLQLTHILFPMLRQTLQEPRLVVTSVLFKHLFLTHTECAAIVITSRIDKKPSINESRLDTLS